MNSNTLNIKMVNYGNKAKRQTFGKTRVPYEMSYLLDVQKTSFQAFLKEGIWEVLNEFNPIVDYSNKAELSFLDYSIDFTPKYSWAECKRRQSSYTVALKVKVRLLVKETGQVMEQEVFLGDIPYMSEDGGFLCNGVERVILNQLIKSPGIVFDGEMNKYGKMDYTGSIAPSHGMWVTTEQVTGDSLRVTVERKYKMSLGVLLKCFGYTNEQLLDIFGNHPFIVNTLNKETQITQEDALIEFSRRTRPGEIPSPSNTMSYINDRFFNHQHYSMGKVGRYKTNKKLGLANRIVDHISAEDIKVGRKVVISKGEVFTREIADKIQNAGINSVDIIYNDNVIRVVGNKRVDLTNYVKCNPKEDFGINGLVYYPLLQEILKENKTEEDILAAIRQNARALENYEITLDDMIATVSYHLNLIDGIGSLDERDHLANRRVACCGELLTQEFRKGMTKLQAQVRETLQSRDLTDITPAQVVNARYINKAFKEFMSTSQLSALMDQVNPVSSLRNKRRLSSFGPGGVKKERASAEVRDINHSHYGRICVVETPEGQPIGLMTSIAGYARINEYGFLETPFRKVDSTGKVTDEIVFMMADEDINEYIATAKEPVDENGRLINENIVCRHNGTVMSVSRDMITYVDLSPKQLISVGASLIPFIEHCAANRALMGTNMQCQAVPLIKADSPIVGTGIEHKLAKDSGALILADGDGEVTYVSADYITVEYDDGRTVNHYLRKFERTNDKTCFNQKPIVNTHERVKFGDVLADGSSTQNGEIALGKNMTIAFMNWEGYNFEDAILVNERIVREDAFTSISIQQVKTEARTTKLGDEEITRDIAGVGEEALKNLDENGIVRIGTEVKVGDILVGKVTPKGETDLTPEERLLKSIFGEKTKEVKNTSLKVKHGEAGVVVGVEILSRKNKDELDAGDKLAGRYGNKGVVSIVLPENDMPFMANGQTVDIVLNPMGIPSRMNLGQLLEMHLGLAARHLDWKVATPSFDSATEEEIQELLRQNNLPEDGKMQLYDGRTGLPFENKTNVGVMYMLKLDHMVEDKIHARSIGTYALITQQPLSGKSQLGGQRFGEMEVWALEAYGASRLLQEMLTIKSDDVEGRIKTYEAIVKGEPIPEPGMPEAFKVLVKEMQGLGLDVKILTADQHELSINEVSDQEVEYDAVQPVNKVGLEDITLEFDQIQESYETDVSEQTFDESALFDDLDD